MGRAARHADGFTGTRATVELTRAGVDFSQHEYDYDPRATSYGAQAARALGVEAAAVFKTLLVALDGSSGRLGVVLVPVHRQVALKAAAAAFGVKRARMADPRAAERSTGYVVGGISPFGQRRRLLTVVDESALAQPAIYVSGGRRGFDVALAPGDLIRVLQASTALIGR